MDLATLVALGTAASALLVVVLLLGLGVRHGRRLERRLVDAGKQVDALRERVETLTKQMNPPPTIAAQEYVITDLSRPGVSETWSEVSPLHHTQDAKGQAPETTAEVTTGAFASLVLGESLVKAVAFGHGVRRALSPENRSRIGFEMRREVRRSRKQRRRDLKQARRHLREDAA